MCVCVRERERERDFRLESRLRAVTAAPDAGSGPHQAGSLTLVPRPKPSSVNVGDETLAPKRRKTQVLWTRDFNREDSEQYLARGLASSSSSISLMSERCRRGHLGPGTGDGSSAFWGPHRVSLTGGLRCQPQEEGGDEWRAAQSDGTQLHAPTRVPGHQGPSKDTKVKLLLFKYKKIS